MVAYGQTVEAESSVLLHDLRGHLLLCCYLVEKPIETSLYEDWNERARLHSSRISSILRYAIDHNNYTSMSNLSYQKTEWEFQRIYISHIFSNWDATGLSVVGELSPDHQKRIATLINMVLKAADEHASIGQIENQVENLLLLMELYQFMGDQRQFTDTAYMVSDLLSKYDLNSLKNKFDRISTGISDYSSFLTGLSERVKHLVTIMKKEGLDKDLSTPLSLEEASTKMSDRNWTIDNPLPFEFPSPEVPK